MSDTINLCHLGVGCIAYETCRTDDLRSGGPCIVREAIAAERSECAKMIEAKWQEARDTEFDLGFETARQCFAAAIRARGQTT